MIELKSRYGDRKVLFKSEKETVKDAVIEAVSSGAYLRGADLSGAYLSGAYLRGADLSGADLSGADLRGAYLRGADLIDAGQDSRGYRFVGAFRDGVRVLAGCRDFTLTEAKEHWASNPEALAKVALIETVAALRRWQIVKESESAEVVNA